jgi:hypothetical protein
VEIIKIRLIVINQFFVIYSQVCSFYPVECASSSGEKNDRNSDKKEKPDKDQTDFGCNYLHRFFDRDGTALQWDHDP